MTSILSLAGVLRVDVHQQISWFQSHGLIARNKNCPVCNHPMNLQSSSDITGKFLMQVLFKISIVLCYKDSMMLHCWWRCPVTSCKQSVSLRSGTFFDKSWLSLKQWLVLFYWWAHECPVMDTAEEAEVERKTAISRQGHLQLANPDTRLSTAAWWTRGECTDWWLFRHKPMVSSWIKCFEL